MSQQLLPFQCITHNHWKIEFSVFFIIHRELLALTTGPLRDGGDFYKGFECQSYLSLVKMRKVAIFNQSGRYQGAVAILLPLLGCTHDKGELKVSFLWGVDPRTLYGCLQVHLLWSAPHPWGPTDLQAWCWSSSSWFDTHNRWLQWTSHWVPGSPSQIGYHPVTNQTDQGSEGICYCLLVV